MKSTMKGLILGIIICIIGATSASSVIYPCPPEGLPRLRHATSCTKYIQCISGIPVVRHCAEGLRFNAATGKCRVPNLAMCQHDEFLCPVFDDPHNSVYLPDNNDCSIYYLCHNGVPRRFDCDEGLQWNSRNQTCDFPDRANCSPLNIECPQDDFQTIPHPRECNRFFRCIMGQHFEARCPDGTLFDVIRGECYNAEHALCFMPTPPVSTTPAPVTTPTPPLNTTPGPTTTPTPPVNTTPALKGNVAANQK
ncbi:uncharacterized protein DMENIID0001_144230 [Sergentomyia squamirostris]